MTANNEDSASDFSSSLITNHHDNKKQIPKSKDIQPRKKPVKITPLPSDESHTSFGSVIIPKPNSSTLTNAQSEKFRERIENEYDILQRSEADYCYYLNSSCIRAREELERSPNGTYFIRQAEEKERTSNIEYFLDFVCHKQITEVPICCDKDRRTFWFLSGCGHGSEVKKVYTGIDVIIRNKQENNFSELSYPFQICLYRPIDRKFGMCIPLPDEVRVASSQNNILHELASQGLSQYFNELIRISKDDGHPLQDKSQFLVTKINGRNKQGLTPLILAVQSKKYQFLELLLDNKANINMTDSQGCSPLHYACRQANPKILKKLIDRHADPHYFNRKKTTDGTYQSNLSAFHYLAMAKGATTRIIKRCAMYLLECGCPLMPLTNEGKSPFDIAEMYQNNAYECVKIFCNRHEFNNLPPMEVSSRNDAKTILSDFACPDVLGKIRIRLKQYDNKDCIGSNGLFLLYKTRRSKRQPNEELGLCVHHDGQVFVYPITEKHKSTIIDSSGQVEYSYCLITDTIKDDQAQVIVFRCCEELVYNHTKYKGILPVKLENYIGKVHGETITKKGATLLQTNNQLKTLTDGEDTEIEDDALPTDVNVNKIDRLDLSQIHSLKLLNENRHRIIWSAKVRLDQSISFPIIIKDYLPNKNIHLYKQYRFNEFHTPSQHRTTNDAFPYEFTSRTHLDYNHESNLLLTELKNHPLIVHTFLCNHHLTRDLRIFMEYLSLGNLHTYLTELKPNLLDPLINAFHWIYQLAQVMAYLSSKKIVHRDLATRNILLQNERHIKLSDFGLSRFEDILIEEKDCVVSPRWNAPECFERNQKISSSSDVWSFGIVIWEIYSFGSLPYEADTNHSSQQLVRFLKRFLVELGRRLSRPDCCSESMYDLICRCWNGNNDKRPRFVDIINDFNGTNIRKDCLVPFSHEERKAWTKAKEEYHIIRQSIQTSAIPDIDYVEVQDIENDDRHSIVTKL